MPLNARQLPIPRRPTAWKRPPRRLAGTVIVLLHIGAIYALARLEGWSPPVAAAAPFFVEILAAPATTAPPAAPLVVPRPPLPTMAPVPVPTVAITEPLAAAQALPAIRESTPPVAPAELPATPASTPPPTQPPAPSLLPSSALQWLEPPAFEYPALARRKREQGTVLVRFWVDAGSSVPRRVEVAQSSGSARLDAAALAAIQHARIRPASENGRPLEGWAVVPIEFVLYR